MTLQAVPPRLVPLQEWAASAGVNYATARKWACTGRLDGSDAQHPQAQQDDQGKWWVAPAAYERVKEVEVLVQMDDADIERIAERVWQRVVARLTQSTTA